MDKVIIHIGYHKSASTFFQKEVFAQLPVNYLFFEGSNQKYLHMVESEKELNPGAIYSWIDSELAEKYPGKRKDTTVLSHEELSGHPHGYKKISSFTIANNLRTLFPAARILIVVRNQFDYIASIYAFRIAVKGYESRSLDRFISEEGAKGLFEHLEYHRLVEHYQQLFGREQVCVLPMELLSRSPDDLFSKLFVFMQLPYQKLEIPRAINVSTKNVLILSFWRPINYLFERLLHLLIFLLGIGNQKSPLRKLRYWFYNSKSKITMRLDKVLLNTRKIDIKAYSQYAMLVERFGKSNNILEQLIGYDLAALGYPIIKDETI